MIQLFLAALLASAPQAPPTVTIDQFMFKPARLSVRAGQSVRFINRDDEAHTVTSRVNVFDSGGLDTDQVWTYKFSKPGTYPYFCSLHPYMTGTIVVVPAGGNTK